LIMKYMENVKWWMFLNDWGRAVRHGFGGTQKGRIFLLEFFVDLSPFIRKCLFIEISNQKITFSASMTTPVLEIWIDRD
jgi:hypothetical protein